MKYLAYCSTDSYGEKTYGIAERIGNEERVVLWCDELELMTHIEEGMVVKGVTLKGDKLECVVQSGASAQVAAARTAIISGFPLSLDNDKMITSITVPQDRAVFDCGRDIMGIREDILVDKSVTIVINDNTEHAETFVGFANLNAIHNRAEVYLDLTKVTREDVLWGVYWTYAASWIVDDFDPIIDLDSRKERLLVQAETDVNCCNDMDYQEDDYA